MSKRVLFTGHGGFVGHHCLEYWMEKTDWKFFCIDSFRHKGTCRRVVEVGGADNPRVKTFRHDLSVPIDPQLSYLMKEAVVCPLTGITHYCDPNYIINMASDSAVERSVTDPTACMRNNYDLMINMLEYARSLPNLKLFLHISTDEVYGEAPQYGGHSEWAPIVPSNPYAASKAAQEALAIAYWRTYNIPVVIVNIMNVIGERQNTEKFLPKLIQNIYQGYEMPIYADSEKEIGSRVYIDAKNVADALMFLMNKEPTRYDPNWRPKMVSLPSMSGSWIYNWDHLEKTHYHRPDRYNICGNAELNNLVMANIVAKIMGKDLKYKLVPSESARPGYDRRYKLDGSKIDSAGWHAPIHFEETIERIVKWTLEHPHWLA